MQRGPAERPAWPGARLGALLVAAGVLALHLALATRYGYFRDELYYIVAGRHPALGYFDFPLGIAMLTALIGHTLGYGLLALHLPPALAHAALVLVAAEIAGELGGGPFARLLAALAAAAAPAFLGSASLLTMDIFDELCWGLAAWAAIRALRRDDPRQWLWFGAAAAAGLLFKLSILFFGAALLCGLLVSPAGRRQLRSRWPWLGGALAAAGLLPYLIWEVAHGWPTLAFYAEYRAAQAGNGQGAAVFLEQQLLLASLFSLPLWGAGLWSSLFGAEGRPLRAIGVAYLLLFVVFAAGHAKVYFLTPLYPVLFGIGAPRVEAWARGWRGWTRLAYPLVVVAGGGVLAPLVMPLLPPAAAAAYATPLHAGEYTPTGDNPIIQPMADRFGWPQQVAAVAGVWRALPAAARAQGCILAGNYGEAAAVDFFGPALGLPQAISGDNQFFLWGDRGCSFAVVVSVGLPLPFLQQLFASVTPQGASNCQYCVPQENGAALAVAGEPRQPPAATWAALRSVG